MMVTITLLRELPSGKPTITSAHNLSSSSIKISWRPPNDSTINGEFLGYQVLRGTNHLKNKSWSKYPGVMERSGKPTGGGHPSRAGQAWNCWRCWWWWCWWRGGWGWLASSVSPPCLAFKGRWWNFAEIAKQRHFIDTVCRLSPTIKITFERDISDKRVIDHYHHRQLCFSLGERPRGDNPYHHWAEYLHTVLGQLPKHLPHHHNHGQRCKKLQILQIYLCYFFQLVLIFGPFWVIFGPFWQFWAIFGPFWVIFGLFWAIFWCYFFWQNMHLCYLNRFLQLCFWRINL